MASAGWYDWAAGCAKTATTTVTNAVSGTNSAGPSKPAVEIKAPADKKQKVSAFDENYQTLAMVGNEQQVFGNDRK